MGAALSRSLSSKLVLFVVGAFGGQSPKYLQKRSGLEEVALRQDEDVESLTVHADRTLG